MIPDTLAQAAWMERAACAGMDLAIFFPSQPPGNQYQQARTAAEAIAVCKTCPVIVQCLAYALEAERRTHCSHGFVAGVYGGTTATQRVEMHKRARRTR